MPISAFGPQGQLRKNALQGTSLLKDPNQASVVSGYNSLYDEAKQSAGLGREGMLTKLSDRFSKFSTDQQRRLEAIAASKRGFETESSTLRDPDKTRTLTLGANEWNRKLKEMPNSGAGGVGGQKGEDWFFALPNEELKKYRDLHSKYRQSYSPKKDGKFLQEREWTANYIKTHANEASAAKSAYENQINASVDKINEQYIPLQTEATDRTARLQDRANLYNMFLGSNY